MRWTCFALAAAASWPAALGATLTDVAFPRHGLLRGGHRTSSATYNPSNRSRIGSRSKIARRDVHYSYPTFANPASERYKVTTAAIPGFQDLGLQDAWAGRIPVNGTDGELFFWLIPSSAPGGSSRTTIWLNGGPGCSSLLGLSQENGPFFMAPGETNPVYNDAGWDKASHMLFVENPVTVGFSRGSTADLDGEYDMADQFYGWLQNFFTIFRELLDGQLFVSGESYAGMYVPFIANRILEASSAEKAALPIRLGGLIINDGVLSSFVVSEQAPTARFIRDNAAILGFDPGFVQSIMSRSQSCGYEAMMDSVQYPMTAGLITLPELTSLTCNVFDDFYQQAVTENPCFNIYRVTDVCPLPEDVVTSGAFFSHSGVQAALNVPDSGAWSMCVDNPFTGSAANSSLRGEFDEAPPSEVLLPGLLARVPVLLWNGYLDAVIFKDGMGVTIQNMTWGGTQGFTQPPNQPVLMNGQHAGYWRAERNLTYVELFNVGHMIPTDSPAMALAVFAQFLHSGTIDGNLVSTIGGFSNATLPNGMLTTTAVPPAQLTGVSTPSNSPQQDAAMGIHVSYATLALSFATAVMALSHTLVS